MLQFKKFGNKKIAMVGLGLVTAMAFALGSLSFGAKDAVSYYDDKDRPENIEIQANQTAFAIPLQGANIDSQKKFMSESYLNEKKVPVKRYSIKHMLVRNPGWERDKYVPAEKLLLVDRIPYSREWAKGADKGTSKANEEIDVESKEGLNISFDVGITASITEEDASRYLYTYGVSETVNPNDPNSNYASTAHARSLEDVMDKVVRRDVQIMYNKELGKYSLIDAIAHKSEVTEHIFQVIKEKYKGTGITISSFGITSETRYDQSIQTALNSVAATNIEATVLDKKLKLAELRKKEAEAKVQEALATALTKNGWDGHIPAFMPKELWDTLSKWVGGMITGGKKG